MVHKLKVPDIILAIAYLIIGIAMKIAHRILKGGDKIVERVASAMNDPGIGKTQVDKAKDRGNYAASCPPCGGRWAPKHL